MRQVGYGQVMRRARVDDESRSGSRGAGSEALFVDAVKKMSLQDAKGILTGGNTSATTTSSARRPMPLRAKSCRIVAQSTKKVQSQTSTTSCRARREIRVGQAADANLDGYVTQKTSTGCSIWSRRRKDDPREPGRRGQRTSSRKCSAR
jgi:hypothetical protein